MEDLTNSALELGRLLAAHNGKNVVVIDLRVLASWTDFFVIVTVTSSAHRGGLERRVKEWTAESGLELRRGGGRQNDGSSWSFIDLGSIVVHLMTESARSFYELEQLWGDGIVTAIPSA